MEKPLLNNPAEFPTEEMLQAVLDSAYDAYALLMRYHAEMQLESMWRYYKDGGAWLCKVQFKKKTVFWLSVWEGQFKASFYFTLKTIEGIDPLPIDFSLKKQLCDAKPIGKLIPMIFCIQTIRQLEDLLVVISYKMKLK